MAKRATNAVSTAKRENTPADAAKSQEGGKIDDLEGKEHTALYLKEYVGIKILVDNQEYTLDKLLDALWTAQEHRDLLSKEIDDAMAATIRIYGEPPYEDCSLREYLEIVADGELDDLRREFEELEGGDA